MSLSKCRVCESSTCEGCKYFDCQNGFSSKRGQWKKSTTLPGAFTCSVCGYSISMKTIEDNFCRNCGADMRQSNFDRIKKMDKATLAKFFGKYFTCETCPGTEFGCFYMETRCSDALQHWLCSVIAPVYMEENIGENT